MYESMWKRYGDTYIGNIVSPKVKFLSACQDHDNQFKCKWQGVTEFQT